MPSVSLRVADLLIASWAVPRESVARVLPTGLEPAEMDGRHLVSLVALRYAGGRLGRLPVPPFSQLNVRVYTLWEGEPAVLLLDARVSPPGLLAQLFGFPFRTSLLRVRRGRADARGLGVRIRYALDGEADPGALGRHALGLFESAGLRSFRVHRGPCRWWRALASEHVRADPLLALGFDVNEPDSLLYAGGASFEIEGRPRLIASTRSSGSRR